MKTIVIDDDLYAFIAGQTKHIGESASDILRRLLLPETPASASVPQSETESETVAEAAPAEVTAEIDSDDILDLVTEKRLSALTKRVDQFLYILSALHALHGESFDRVEQIRGKNRTYFATSKAALLENGSSTNPKSIPDSPYWVVTNNNTAKKITMLDQVMQQLGYAEEVRKQVQARFAPES